jgi:hypothetical protein
VIFALDKEALTQLRAAGAHAFYIADVQLHAHSQGDQGSAPLGDLSTRSRQGVFICNRVPVVIFGTQRVWQRRVQGHRAQEASAADARATGENDTENQY